MIRFYIDKCVPIYRYVRLLLRICAVHILIYIRSGLRRSCCFKKDLFAKKYDDKKSCKILYA